MPDLPGPATLTIDLAAIVENWRRLRRRLAGGESAAVVKADAYGLGAERVAPALAAAGCRHFFIAHPAEGLALRQVLPAAEIFVLHGLGDAADELAAHRLVPVLNGLDEVARWSALARARNGRLPAAIHIDTGMTRLGLSPAEVGRLAPADLAAIDLRLVMSHLACAEETANPLNREQLRQFLALRALLPPAPASIANSSGIFLGPDYHLDLVRPGIALYGGNPLAEGPNPMAEVVRLQGRILQVRDVDTARTVGYGATHRLPGGARVATVAVGYADGYLRSLSNRGFGYIGGIRVPVVGRVSMDLITLDVSMLDRTLVQPGTIVDLIGGPAALDDVAAAAGSISYELLTRLGRRYRRHYPGGG